MAEDITNFDDQFEEQSQMADFLGPAKIGVNLPSNNIVEQNPTYSIKDNTVGSAPNFEQSAATQINPAKAALDKAINLAVNNQDDTNYNKPYIFDSSPAAAHKARYKAYGQETFDRIGFDPMIDNEAWFNKNTTIGDDAKRWLTHSAAPMLGLGILANPKSYGRIISDFDFGADPNEAELYEEYNQLGYSTKGGVGGFLVNLGNSASYSAGILLEGAIEGALIGAAVGFAEGGVTAIPGAAIGGVTGMFKNIPKLFKSIGQGVKGFAKTLQAVNKLQDVNAARNAWKNAGKTMGNFINPLSNTKNAYLQYIAANPDNLTNLARNARTAGAFMHDIKNINMALSEGRLEGGFAENEIYKQLYNDYYDTYGVVAPDEVQQNFRKQAKAGGMFNTIANAAVVFYSNKIAFPSVTQARFLKGVPKFSKRVGRVGKNNIIYKPGKTLKDDLYLIEKANAANAAKALLKPAAYGRVGLNYFKANLVEGLQEVTQDILQDATKNYYVNTYKNPAVGNYYYAMGLLRDSFYKSMSAQGLETFLSGFFMGSVLQIPGKLVNFTQNQVNKYKDREAYEKTKTQSDEVAQDIVNSLNEMTKNGKFFFDPRLQNYGVQFTVARDLDKDDTTLKQIKDGEFAAFQKAVFTAIRTGTFDMFLKNFAGYKNYTAKELEEALNLEKGQGQSALDNIDNAVKNANIIKNRYDYAIGKFKQGPNPADFEDGSADQLKAIVYQEAFQAGIGNFVFLGRAFDDSLTRAEKLLSKLGKIDTIQNSRFTNAQFLVEQGGLFEGTSKLATEIELLKSETESLKQTEDPAAQKQIRDNEAIIEALEDFYARQTEFTQILLGDKVSNQLLDAIKVKPDGTVDEDVEALNKANAELVEELSVAYKDSFNNLLKTLASTQSDTAVAKQEIVSAEELDDLFTDLVDMHVLKHESNVLSKYVSLIADPGGFYEHVNRNYDWMLEEYLRREETFKELVNAEFKADALNGALNHLAEQGIFVDLEELADFLENGTLPEYFIDTKNRRYITKDNIFYNQYFKTLKEAKDLSERKPAGEASNNEEVKAKKKEEYAAEKAKEEELARKKYEENLKKDTGFTEAEIVNNNEEAKAKAQEDLTKAESDLKIVKDGLETVKTNDYDAINTLADTLATNNIILDSRAQQIINETAKDKDFQKAVAQKLKKLTELNPELSEEEINVTAYYITAIEKEFASLLDTLPKQIEELKLKTETDIIDLTAEPAYIAYQQELEAIAKKYEELEKELDKALPTDTTSMADVKEMSTDMEWDDLDQELRIILQPKFIQHLSSIGVSPELQDLDEPEYNKIRKNWLETQGEVVNKYNADKKAKAAELKKKSATAPEFEKIENYDLSELTLKQLVSIRENVQELVDTGVLKRESKDKDGKTKTTTQEVGKEDIEAFARDLEKLDIYIENRRNNPVTRKPYQAALDLFKERILARQNEVEVIKDEEGNVVSRKLKDKTTERPSSLAAEIEQEILEKDPFRYNQIDPLLEVYDTVVEDSQPEDVVSNFITALKAYKSARVYSEKKIEDIEEELNKDSSRENVERVLIKYAFKERSEAGTQIDNLIREFLTVNTDGTFNEIAKPENMSQEAFDNLFGVTGVITKVRDGIIDGKYFVVASNFLIFDENLRDSGVAGEIDLLTIKVDEETGEFSFRIVDIKTGKEDNWKQWGQGTLGDKKVNYSAQQSIYANLIYNMTGIEPEIALIPIALDVTLDGEIRSAKLSNVLDKQNKERKDADKEPLDTLELEYLKEVEAKGIVKIKPEFKEEEDDTKEDPNTEAEKVLHTLDKYLGKKVIYQGQEGILTLNEDGTYTVETTTPASTDAKAGLERKITKVISSETVEKGRRKGQTRTVTQTNSIEEVEGTKVSVTEYEAKLGDTTVTFGGRRMTFKEFKEEFPLDEDYEEILGDWSDLNDDTIITVKKVNRTPSNSRFKTVVSIYSPVFGGKMDISIKENDAKYDAELAALQGKPQVQQPVGEVKEGVEELFDSNPELASIGTPQQYSAYLDTIFPDSKVKDIVYHVNKTGTISIIDNKAFYSTDFGFWLIELEEIKGKRIPILLNITNPTIVDSYYEFTDQAKKFRESELGDEYVTPDEVREKNTDSVIGRDSGQGANEKTYVTYKKEQVYQLGSKQDIQGFKEFAQGTQPTTQPVTKIIDITQNGLPVKDGTLVLESLGVQPLRRITNVGQVSVIEGELVEAEFVNKSERQARINGVTYRVNRNNLGEIVSLTYNVNDEKIAEIDFESGALMTQLNLVRKQLGSVQDDTERLDLIDQELDITDRLKALNNKRKGFVENNPQRTMRGTTANNYIFALNRLPNEYQKAGKKDTKVDTIRQAKIISNISAVSTVADQVTAIMAAEYPAEVDKLLEKGALAITKPELDKITLWAQQTISELENLALNLIDDNIPITDVEDQIKGLTEFLNDLELIKLNKDGRISKRQKEANKVFGPKAKGVSKRTDIPADERSIGGETKTVPGKTTRNEIKNTIKSTNKSDEDLINDILGSSKKAPKKTKAAAKEGQKLIDAISAAKNSEELEAAKTEAIVFLAKNLDAISSEEIDAAYEAKALEIYSTLSKETLSVDQVLISKNPIFTEESEVVVVKSIKEDEVSIQPLYGEESRTFTYEELNENFMSKEAMELSKEETPKTDVSQETKESMQGNDEVLNEMDSEEIADKINESPIDEKSMLDQLNKNSKLC